VNVLVPDSKDYGYDIQASTTNGGIEYSMSSVEVLSDSEAEVHLRTRGYPNVDPKVDITLSTTNGGINIGGS